MIGGDNLFSHIFLHSFVFLFLSQTQTNARTSLVLLFFAHFRHTHIFPRHAMPPQSWAKKTKNQRTSKRASERAVHEAWHIALLHTVMCVCVYTNLTKWKSPNGMSEEKNTHTARRAQTFSSCSHLTFQPGCPFIFFCIHVCVCALDVLCENLLLCMSVSNWVDSIALNRPTNYYIHTFEMLRCAQRTLTAVTAAAAAALASRKVEKMRVTFWIVCIWRECVSSGKSKLMYDVGWKLLTLQS